MAAQCYKRSGEYDMAVKRASLHVHSYPDGQLAQLSHLSLVADTQLTPSYLT